MAIAEDASTPAVVRSTVSSATQTWSTAAFSPPADSLLVVLVNNLISFATTHAAFTVSDSAGGTWTQGVDAKPAASDTCHSAVFYSYRASAPGPITVTVDKGDTWTSDTQLTVRVVTGAATNQTGAATVSYFVATGSAPTNATQQNITTTTVGSRVYAAVTHNSTNAITANANTTNIDTWTEATIFCVLASARQTNTTVTPGATSIGYTGQSSANNVAFAAMEILQSTGPGYNPPTGMPPNNQVSVASVAQPLIALGIPQDNS